MARHATSMLLPFAALVAAPLAGGCASSRVTDPDRTATEQFLLSQAAAESVAQLAFDVLRGRRVFVEQAYFAASERAFVIGELRARLLLSGVQLVDEPDDAQIILELRSGGVGIDRNDLLVGIPAFGVPTAAAGAGVPPVTTPELALFKRRTQKGIASVAYVAYWRETGEVVATSGPFIGRTLRDDFWFFGVGPRSLGDIPPIEPEPPLAPARARDQRREQDQRPDEAIDRSGRPYSLPEDP